MTRTRVEIDVTPECGPIVNVAGDRRRIFVDHERQRLQRAFVVGGEIDAHADRHDGGILGAARRIEHHKAGAVENRAILEDVALDAVPGFFRRLVRGGSGRLARRAGGAGNAKRTRSGPGRSLWRKSTWSNSFSTMRQRRSLSEIRRDKRQAAPRHRRTASLPFEFAECGDDIARTVFVEQFPSRLFASPGLPGRLGEGRSPARSGRAHPWPGSSK